MYTYKLGGMLITDELYHDDLEGMTFGRKDQNELMHYGIKGQSWGKRRFQNEDGSLTMAGRNRYDVGDPLQGSTNRAMAANRTYATGGGTGGFGGASGGGGSVRPKGSGTTRTYGSFIIPGGKSYESHHGPGQSAGRTVTNKVKAKVNDTVNSGRKAADNLFSRVGNWASNAAKDVGNFATNTYNDASKAVTNAANDVSKAATNAYNDASKWVEDRAKDVGNAAVNAYKDVNNFVDKNITGNSDRSLAKSLNMVADSFPNSDTSGVRRSAEESKAKADNSLFGRIGNAFDDTKNWVGDRAQDVGNFVDQNITGNSARQRAETANNLANAIPGINPDNVRVNGKTASENQAEADNSLLGRIGNAANDAKNWVGDRAQDVGKTASNVYNDVSKAAGDAVNWVGDRARDVGNLVSNQDEKRAAENAQNVADRVLDGAIARSGEYVPDEKGGEDLYIRDYNDAKVVDAADKRAADAQQAYENHPLTKIQNAANDVGNFVSNTANDVKNLFSDGSKERKALVEARSKVDKSADDPEFMAYFSKNYPEEAKKYAEEQAEARKQLEQAEKNYMDFSNNPTNTVARALNLPNNKGNWAFAVPGNEQYLQTMNTGFVPKTENIADWFTGNNYKRTADTHNQYAKDYDDLAEQAYAYGRESAETGRGPSQDWWNSEGDYIKNTYAKEDRDIANANMNMYNNAPRQKIVNAANQVGETISGAAKDVGNWAGNAANDVANWGGQQVENGKKLFKKIFG